MSGGRGRWRGRHHQTIIKYVSTTTFYEASKARSNLRQVRKSKFSTQKKFDSCPNTVSQGREKMEGK